jgi:hypothetical protein
MNEANAIKGGSPSPEARVDWEKEAKELVENRKIVGCVAASYPIVSCYKPLIEQDIAKALSAAFEKGREAR